ncbi:MAG: hypothetical protein GY797_35290 [Deltaproteobacteria bacterium]|nr:hypothetical protein [Deltaproteobacteria bacterium]
MNQIIHGDSYKILPELPDKSFDTVILDPPYGYKMDKWDNAVDVAFFTAQAKRICRNFFAVFGQMPYLREWDHNAMKQGFHFKSHITWVKRSVSPYGAALKRSHEDIYIYTKQPVRKFYKTEGKYEDVKTPGILFDVLTIESIKRYISALRQELTSGEPSKKKTKNRVSTGSHRDIYKSLYDTFRAKETANFTDVWSFLPESKKTYHKGGKFHRTMKPILLEMRLVEILTPENGSVLDCFSGSGTTAIACQRLDRQFLCIEKELALYEQSVQRLNNDVWQPELAL